MNSNQEPSQDTPQVVNKVDQEKLTHFVTAIKSAEQQVGEHIIAALRHSNTVAVVTTVAMGADGQQKLVSAALDPRMMNDVQRILTSAQEEREPEEPCVGFHCLIKPKQQEGEASAE